MESYQGLIDGLVVPSIETALRSIANLSAIILLAITLWKPVRQRYFDFVDGIFNKPQTTDVLDVLADIKARLDKIEAK